MNYDIRTCINIYFRMLMRYLKKKKSKKQFDIFVGLV
jgi:hypothetical protein